MTKIGGKNTDDGIEIIVEPEIVPQDILVRTERPAPKTVADNSCRSKTEGKVLRAEEPSDLRGCAEHGEVIGADDHQFETLRLLGAGQVHTHRPDNAYILKDTCASLEILEFGYGERDIPQADAGIVEGNFLQCVRIVKRESAQQDGIHDAEGGGVGADAQRQREHDHDRECRRLAKNAQRELYVLENSFHRVILRRGKACTHPARTFRRSFTGKYSRQMQEFGTPLNRMPGVTAADRVVFH